MVEPRGPVGLGLLLGDELPEITWVHGDDLCDCIFQRIGEWSNPYLARTLRVRMCCLWDRIYAEHPDLVELIPAYHDQNADKLLEDPLEWNGDHDMPRWLWHRQLSTILKKPLDEIRRRFGEQKPPQAVKENGNREPRKTTVGDEELNRLMREHAG
jgi:hypothetical protein